MIKPTNKEIGRMKKILTNCKLGALLIALSCAVGQAGTLEVVSAPSYNAPLRDSSGSLLSNAWISFGSFGNKSASDVAALFSGVTGAAQVGSVLSSNYTSLMSPGYLGTNGSFVFNNGDGYEPTNLLDFNNTPMYSVISHEVSSGLYELGIFAAYDFTRSGTVGSYIYTPGAQINFTNLADGLGVDTFRFRQAVGAAGGAGAVAVSGLGASSPTGFSLSSIQSTVAVPEPSSISLLFAGGLGLLALRRLRNNV